MARLISIEPAAEKTITHKDCGAKIGYFPNEVQNSVYEDYGGGRDTWYWIICPNCGKKVEVNNPYTPHT